MASSRKTDLSKSTKIFPDGVLCCLGDQPPNKDLLDGFLLHCHRLLGVNWTSVQSVILLLQYLQTHMCYSWRGVLAQSICLQANYEQHKKTYNYHLAVAVC